MKLPARQHIIRIHNYGGAEELKMETADIPHPGEKEVLIRILAAGVNPIDWKMREGFRSVPLPFIPGIEGCGQVVQAGSAVPALVPGKLVYGAMDHCYAEYTVAPAEQLFLKPEMLTVEEAAAMGGAKTAWGALFEVAHLEKGQTILIHAASGGVGIFAVQLARLAGARVIATTSNRNAMLVQSLGADEIIDYQKQDFEKIVANVDVVLDLVGGETLEKSYRVVKKGGILVGLVSPVSEQKATEFGIRAVWGGRKSVSSMRMVNQLVGEGRIRPIIRKVFISLEAAAEAQRFSQRGGEGAGKVVLRVAQG